MTNPTKKQWSSSYAFILATTGAAVGLGNIWRFPYMAGMNGGSAFVLVYLICVLLIGLPVLIAEIVIGRAARRNTVDALTQLAKPKHSPHWGMLGYWGAIALLLVLSFYSVVSGWSIAYFIKAISGQLHDLSTTQVQTVWTDFQSQPLSLLLWHSLFMGITAFIVMRGITKGLEKTTNFLMPLLYLILITLVCYAAFYGNLGKAWHFLFALDFSKITAPIVIAALGHAFFSMAVGAGAMLTYGAYAPRSMNIVPSVMVILILDIFVALLSGLAIFPIIFAEHLTPASGPGLMFISLPIAFSHIPGGGLIASAFFLLLFCAALTSSINLAEPLVLILMDKCQLSRRKATYIIGSIAWILGIGSLLSFNLWQNIKLAGFTVFDVISNGATDIFLPVGGIGFTLFAGWIMQRHKTQEELKNTHPTIFHTWRFLIRWIAPIGIFLVFITPLLL